MSLHSSRTKVTYNYLDFTLNSAFSLANGTKCQRLNNQNESFIKGRKIIV